MIKKIKNPYIQIYLIITRHEFGYNTVDVAPGTNR